MCAYILLTVFLVWVTVVGCETGYCWGEGDVAGEENALSTDGGRARLQLTRHRRGPD